MGMPHLLENSWRWLSYMEPSHSAQHSQMLPRDMTNKKDFQFRSDDIARGEYLHPSVEQVFRASKQSLQGWGACYVQAVQAFFW